MYTPGVGILGATIKFHLPYLPWIISLGWVLRNKIRRSEHFMVLGIHYQIYFLQGRTNLPVIYFGEILSIHLLNFLVLQVYYLFSEVDIVINLARVLKLRILLRICHLLHLEELVGDINHPLSLLHEAVL